MSTDYRIVCFDCKKEGPTFASGSISYGYKVWLNNDDLLKWLGHREDNGKHEGHDLRIVSENKDLPFEDEQETNNQIGFCEK